MAANGGKIQYTIGFNVDKAGLNEIYKSLAKIQTLTTQDLMKGKPINLFGQVQADLKETQAAASAIGSALQKSFNTKINTVNISAFRKEIEQSYGSVQNLYTALNKGGYAGQQTASLLTKQLLTTNTTLHKTETLLDKMGTTFMNTIKWTLSSSVIKRVTGALSQAVGYVEHLDNSLNDIRIVTKKSADEMEKFGQQANKAAQALGKATTDYTEATLIYYQQGLSDEEVKARAETTLKAANVTGQATKTVSEQLTAVWNGFRVNAEQTEEYVDKLAAVAAMSASNLEELSTGMSKVASAASNLGVDIDQLTAQIATIVSVTRQAPESVGTALKTIYARISDLKLGENDEDGLGLGDVSGGLKKLGIEILDSEGELRDLGIVIEEVAAKWDGWTSAQQAAIAQLMAGKRQYNNLVALFSNWDMYENAINTSRNATGELQKQQDIYMESTEAHLQQLKTQWEDLYDSILDADSIKGFADGLTTIVKGITTFVDSIGGGTAALSHLIGLLGSLISGKLAQGLNEFIGRGEQNKAYIDQLQQRLSYAKEIGQVSEASAKHMSEYYNAWGKYAQYMSEEQIKQAEMRTKEIGDQSDMIENQKKENALLDEKILKQQKIIVDAQVNLENKKKQLQVDKETAAAQIKTMEQAMWQRKFQNPGGTDARWTDHPANVTKMDIAAQWGQTNASADVKNIEQDILQVEQTAKNAAKAVNSFQASLSNYKTALASQNTKDVNTSFTNLTKQANKAKMELTQLYKAGEISEAKFKDLKTQLDKINISNVGEKGISKVASAMQEVGQITDSTKKKIVKWKEVLSNSLDSKVAEDTKIAIQKATEEINNLNNKKLEGVELTKAEEQELERLKEIQNEYYMQRQATFQGILQTVMGIQQLGNSISTLKANIKGLVSGEASFGSIISQISSLGVTGLMTFKMLKSGISALQSSSVGFLQKIGGFLSTGAGVGIMAGLTAIAATVSIVSGIVEAGYEKAAEKANQAAEAQQKIIDNASKEKDVVDDLLKSYQKIADAREDGIHYTEDQKTAIFDLVKAYGDESLMLQALSEDYEKLEESIRKARIEAQKQEQEELSAGQEKYESAIIADIKKNGGITEIDPEGFDFTKAEDLTDWASDLGKLIGRDKHVVDSSGHVDYNVLMKILESDEKALYDFIKKYDGLDATDQLRKLLADNNSNLEKLHEVLDKNKELSLNLTGDKFVDNLGEISNAADFEQAVQDLSAKVAKNFNSEEEGIQWAREFLQGVSEEFNNFGKANLIADNILNKVSNQEKALEVSDELNNRISGLSQSAQGFFAGNVDFIASLIDKGRSIDEIFSMLDDHLKSLTYSDHIVEIHTIINESDKKKLKEEIHTLFSDKDFDIGISEESFLGLDKGIQHSMLLMQQFKETEESNNLFAKDKESIEQMNKEIQDSIDKETTQLLTLAQEKQNLQDFIEKDNPTAITEINKELNYFLEQSPYIEEMFGKTEEELTNSYRQAMDKLSEFYIEAEAQGRDFQNEYYEIFSELPEEFQGFIRYMGKTFNIEDTVKQWSNHNKEIKSAEERLKEIEKEISSTAEEISDLEHSQEKLNNKDKDYVSILTDLQTLTEELNKNIDELQTSYQDLQGVIEDYNEDGYLTLDNLQKIMEMDSSYLAALEMENGQLKLNDETYRNLIQTQLHLMEVEATEQYLTELSAIAKGEVVTASQRLDAANIDNVNTINQVTAAAREGTQALFQLAQAKQAAQVDSQATAEVTQAYYNKMQLIRNVASQPTSKILGKTSSSKGKSGSSSKPKTEKYLEREEDIYRKINEELDQIESTLGRIDTMASHEWGYDYQKTLEEQNKLLDQQLKKLQEKNKLQVKDLATRRKQLEDVGVTFSEDGGVMNNAEQILNNLYAGYNSMVDKYNKMSVSGQEAYKAQLETEKNRIDAIEKKIDEYESTYSDFQSTLDELQDVHYQQIENEVNQFNNMVDVHLELNDARKEWNTFWKEVIEDVQDTDFGGQVAASLKQLEVLTGLGGDVSKSTIGLLTDQLNKTTAEVNKQIATAAEGGVGSIFGDDSAKSKENLTNRINQLMSALRDAKAEVEAIGDNYIKQLEEEQKLVDKQADAWNVIDKHLEHNIELIKLLDGEKAFDALNTQYEKQYENNLNSITTQRLATEDLEKKVKEYKEWMETAEKGSIEWQTASKAYDEAVENYIKATENLDSAIVKALNDLKKQTENANAKAIDTFDKAMSDGLGTDLLAENWKLINDYASKYYDNVERYLNMSEYENLLEEAANAIGISAENQQKLNEFREQELKQLNERKRLTEYDIAESRARLEILKAQIALEDTQANKSKMRLRRDSQGNYNYQYVADEDQVNKNQQDLLNAQKNWYQIWKNQLIQGSNDLIETRKLLSQKMSELADAEGAKDQKRIQEIESEISLLTEELERQQEHATKVTQDGMDGIAQYFSQVENASILPQSEATVRKLVDEWAGEGRNSFVGAVKTAVTELDSIQAQFVQNSDKILTTANRNYQELKSKGIDPTLKSLKDLAGTNDELADKMGDVNEKLAEMAKNLGLAEAGYTTLKDSAAAALTEAQKSLETLADTYIQTQQKIKAAADSATSAPSISYNKVTPSSSGGGSGGGGTGTGVKNNSTTLAPKEDMRPFIIVQNHPNKPAEMQVWNYGGSMIQNWTPITDGNISTIKDAQNYDAIKKNKKGTIYPMLKRNMVYKKGQSKDPGSFWILRSGGYTGSWGDDSGRWALLHQKELVLNEDDTKNMLSAVQILRSIPYSVIAQSLVNSSMNTASALSGINSGISGLSAAAGGDTTKTMVVNADFSGVHDADEIYQALVELENYGLQNSYSVAPHANSMY